MSRFIRWMKLHHPLCMILGHDRTMDDMGGVIYETCTRCPWVGRHVEYKINYREQP